MKIHSPYFSPHWDDTGSWNPTTWKTWTYLPCIGIAADGIATQEARAPTAIILTKFGPSVPFKMWHQRKHQSSASLAFVRRIHRGPVNSPHKGPVTRKMFPFDDVIMGTNFPQSLVFLLTWTSVAVLLVSYCGIQLAITLQRRHNECDGVSNQQLHDCLFNRLFRCRSKKISKLRGTGLCEFKNLLNTWWYWFHNAITEYICSIWTGAF